MEIKIRKAKISDINNCLGLQKLDKEDYWKKEDLEKAIRDRNTIFIVAEKDKNIAGYILGFTCPTKKTDVMVHETRVNKELRGEKIGTRLVNAFCKEAFQKKAKHIYALIEEELAPFYLNSCKFKKTQKWLEVKKSRP